jgi:hypothetical protein
MSSQQNSQNWQRGTNEYGNRYDHRGDGAAQGGKLNRLILDEKFGTSIVQISN